MMLENIHKQIPEISSTITDINSAVKNMGAGLNPEKVQQQHFPTKEDTDSAVKLAIKRTSLIGLMALKAIVISTRTSKPIPLNFEDATMGYHLAGYISGLSAMSWLNFHIVNNTVSVTSVNQSIMDNEKEIDDEHQKRDKNTGVENALSYLIDYFDQP